jgi:hypothetical protein
MFQYLRQGNSAIIAEFPYWYCVTGEKMLLKNFLNKYSQPCYLIRSNASYYNITSRHAQKLSQNRLEKSFKE